MLGCLWELFFILVPYAFINAPWWVILVISVITTAIELSNKFLPAFIVDIALYGPWIWALISTVTSTQTIWSVVFYALALVQIIRIIKAFSIAKDVKSIFNDSDN